MKDFDRLGKTLKEHGLDWKIKSYMMLDTIHLATMSISWMTTLPSLSILEKVLIHLFLETLKRSTKMALLYAKLECS